MEFDPSNEKRFVLRFDTEEEALEIAMALSGNPDVETLPLDGWLASDVFGHGYYNIHVIGHVLDEDGEPRPGFYLGGIWRSASHPLPAPLAAHVTADDVGWWWGDGERWLGD